MEKGKQKKSNKQISRSLIASIIIIAVIISLASCVTGYIQYDNTMRRLYNENGYVIGEIILNQLDHQKIANYAETWAEDDYYPEMAKYLEDVRVASGAAYVYIAVPDGKVEGNGVGEGTMRYIYDCTGMQIGDVDPVPAFYEEFEGTYKTGEKTGNYYVRHSPKYGYLTSCMLPVNDESGKTVAILFVDVFMTLIVSTLVGYIVRVAVISVILVAIFCAIYYTFIRKTVIHPIHVLKDAATGLVRSNMENLDEFTIPMKTGNEFDSVAASFTFMAHELSDYIKNLESVTAEKNRIGAELDVAAHIQSSMLPCIFPAFPDNPQIDIYATMTPAKEVGGDFYDFFFVDRTHIAIVMADVSGKGVPAALFMVIGKTLIKDHTVPGQDLGKVFSQVNNMLCEANSEGLFITAFEGVLDLVTGEFDFVNAGHEMPFICKKGDVFKPYKIKAGFVLAGMEDMRYRSGSIMLEPGDKIYQYTDGVTEATNAHNQLFGMERLEKSLAAVSDKKPDEILPAVKADIDAFVGSAPQFDDITMLCLEYKERMEA